MNRCRPSGTLLVLSVLLLLVLGCRDRSKRPTTAPPQAQTAAAKAPPPAVTVVAAGDIAGPWVEDEATAALIDKLAPDYVLGLGDMAYRRGTPAEYAQFYAPTWGRHRAKTLPAPGNHDHGTEKLAGYCDYFGRVAGCQDGNAWYALDVGSWRVLSLDSGGGEPGSPTDPMVDGSAQRKWLRETLAKNPKRCTLVFWHHPLFSSGAHGPDVRSQGIWSELQQAGVDLVLAGHDHHYERFHPMNAAGERDEANGIVQFIVGTGGARLYELAEVAHPQSAVRQASAHGVLKLRLEDGGFEWTFVPVAGRTFEDSGRARCH